jgi:transposase
MKKSKFTEEQIAYVLRQVEGGAPVPDVCRQMGVSEATFYIWKKKYAHLGVSELGRCARSRTRMRASSASSPTCRWTNTFCRRRCEKKSEAHTAPRAGRLGPDDLRRQLRTGPRRALCARKAFRPVGSAPWPGARFFRRIGRHSLRQTSSPPKSGRPEDW